MAMSFEWLKIFKKVEREGTSDDWAAGFSITFVDEFGKTWHMSASMDPKHWEEDVNRSEIIHTRDQLIKRMKRIL